MRISDWSSDVCSSDLFRAAHSIKGGAGTFGCFGHLADTTHLLENLLDAIRQGEMPLRKDMIDLFQIGSASCRERVGQYVSRSEGAVSLKKNTTLTNSKRAAQLKKNEQIMCRYS